MLAKTAMEHTPDTITSSKASPVPDVKSPKKHEKMPPKDKPHKVKNAVYLWDKKGIDDLFQSLTLATSNKDVDSKLETTENLNDKTQEHPELDMSHDIRSSDKMSCATCAVIFIEREEQKEHFKSDWHRFNLKNRLRGRENVTESKFEDITNAGDLSSISGSDSSEEDEVHKTTSKPAEEEEEEYHIEGIGRRHPRVFLRNNTRELMSVYRCIIHGKKNQAESVDDLVSMVTDLPAQMTWAIIMMAGGHFAAAIFDGTTVVEHKTFHRYVVRAKRGTVQSSRDGKGHAPRSGGATLRRYNEAALSQEIQDLLTDWSQHINRCHRIFIRAPTYSKSVFYGGKTPVFDKHDQRIRLIPFQTRRPTFKELHRVHELLATVQCYGADSSIEDHITLSPKKLSVVKSEQRVSPATVLVNIPDDSVECDSHQHDKDDVISGTVDISIEGIDMVVESLTISTDHLQEFDNTTKSRKKKKSAKTKKLKDEESPATDKFTDEESKEFRNVVYTACKTNNTQHLQTFLQDMKIKFDSTRTLPSDSGENSDPICPDVPLLENNDDVILQCETGENNEISSNQNMKSDHDVSSDQNVNSDQDVSSDQNVKSDHDVSSDQNSQSDDNTVAEMLNYPFGYHGLTLLHIAATECNKTAISLLLEYGADPTVKDGQGQLPYICTSHKDTRNEFRRFMAKYPDKYNYNKAQIPGPLFEDQEKDKKARETERKKQLKKIKKDRLKDQKAEEAKQREEEREKQRYLKLSDREKRAMAAEKRLTAQVTSTGQAPPVLIRCFQCASDITGKVPFEYKEYKFCTPRCLKEHRLANAKKS